MNDFKKHLLWSVPIYESKIAIKKEWAEFSKNCDFKRMISDNGNITKDFYVLDKLPELKNIILQHKNNYVYDFLKIKTKFDFYLLNSWITEHKPNDFAHSHIHANSLLSGVVYLNVPKNSGKIVFTKDYCYNNIFFPNIFIEFEENNHINCVDFWFEPKEGDILIFPSRLLHSVEKNLSNQNRYCLSFNFFVKGEFGNKNESTLLLK
jgi:uncharacterized protein (TIGR02466 family)